MDRLEEMEKKQRLGQKYESTKRIFINRHELSDIDEDKDEEEDGGGDEGEDGNEIIIDLAF